MGRVYGAFAPLSTVSVRRGYSAAMGRAARAYVSLALALSLASPPALAQRAGGKPTGGASSLQSAPADVETAEQLYAKLDYDGANAVAERVVKKTGLTHDQLLRAYRVLAVTCAILDREEQARDAFLQLLTYEPDYQADPNLGPKVNTPFMEARGSFRSLSSKPGIEVSASVSTSGGTLRVTTRDPTRIVKRVNVGYRWTSSGEYSISQINPGEVVVAVEVAAPPAGRTRLDFYVQALDERDNAVLEAGNPSVPKSAFAEAGASSGAARGSGKAEGGSVFSSPIFWIATGLAVLGGGAAAAYFAFRPQDPPTRASLSPVIVCGSDRCN